MISREDRRVAIELIDAAMAEGARQASACEVVGIASRTYQRWQKAGLTDRRQVIDKPAPANKLNEQEWSWDITYLASSVKGLFFYLYLFMDIYSRKIVGWEVYETESSEQAAQVLRKTRLAEAIAPGQEINLHTD